MSIQNLTDFEIARAFPRDSSDELFEAVVRQKYGFVYGVCLRKLKNEMNAEDAAQAVFITLAAKQREIKSGGHLTAWLYKTASFACNNLAKIDARNRRKIAIAENEMQREASYISPGSPEIDDLLDKAIGSLSDPDRAAVLLRFADGLTVSEIAEALRISHGAAAQRIARSIEKLRAYFMKNGVVLTIDVVGSILADKLAEPNTMPDIDAILTQIRSAIGAGNSSAHVNAISQGVILQMKILQTKVILTTIFGIGIVAGASFLAVPHALSNRSATPLSSLATGYSEHYTFRTGNKSIGTQSATLTSTSNGLQTWSFNIDLLIPTASKSITLKQTGTFVIDSTAHPVRFDTTSVVNGAKQGEKITFNNGTAKIVLDPAVPSIASSFPVSGHPYLLVNNLLTLMSLITRVNHNGAKGSLDAPTFSVNVLRPVDLNIKPLTATVINGIPSHVCKATFSGTGIPSTTNEFTLADSTGELLRLTDKSQNLVVVKD